MHISFLHKIVEIKDCLVKCISARLMKCLLAMKYFKTSQHYQTRDCGTFLRLTVTLICVTNNANCGLICV